MVLYLFFIYVFFVMRVNYLLGLFWKRIELILEAKKITWLSFNKKQLLNINIEK